MTRTWTALYSSICTSKKLRSCSSDASRLFYLLLLTQADPWGRIEDDPEVLNVRVWPLLGRSEKDTEKALADLTQAGLISRRDAKGVRFLQVEDWSDHAGKHQGGSKGSPKFPEPSGEIRGDPGTSGEIRSPSLSLSISSESQRESGEREVPAFPPPLDTPEFRSAWDDLQAYRRERKLPTWKPMTVKANLERFASWGVADAIEQIRATIRHGWQGVFDPKKSPLTRESKGAGQPSFAYKVFDDAAFEAGRRKHLGLPPEGGRP